jgi:hypothetical protein
MFFQLEWGRFHHDFIHGLKIFEVVTWRPPMDCHYRGSRICWDSVFLGIVIRDYRLKYMGLLEVYSSDLDALNMRCQKILFIYRIISSKGKWRISRDTIKRICPWKMIWL